MVMLFKLRESGYHNRLNILEIDPFPKEHILNYLIGNLKNKITDNNEAEKYYSLFDGNMAKIKMFKDSELYLNGLCILFYLF